MGKLRHRILQHRNMNKFKQFIFFCIILFFISQTFAQPLFVWGKQFGTKKVEAGQDMVVYESGEFVLTGSTTGDLYSSNLGNRDGFIVKYDSMGHELWKSQFGSDQDDKPWELEKDAHGNLYVAGITKGIINGQGHGNQDILIYKYNPEGILKKTKIFGTDSLDYLSEIYIDKDFNIYIAGNTKGQLGANSYGDWDYFIMKLDSGFSEIYTLQFGTEKWDYCNDFIIDKNSDVYFAGFTFGNLGKENIGNTDAFIAQYTREGDLIRLHQFGTAQAENVSNIIIDSNENIYISGTSHGNIVGKNNGKSDVFIMKLDKNWDVIWEKQFGTNSWDEAWHMDFIKSEKEFLISGSSNPDAYIRLYDIQGNLKWNQVFAARGIKAGTGGRHFCVYQDRIIYFTGFTFADLFSQNPNQKEDDAFIVKLELKSEQ
jgi:hypothetical protein